jgi:hypothetical protein
MEGRKRKFRPEGRRLTPRRFIWEGLTGEWMFWCGRPNGGGVIFFRSVWISVILYVIGLALRSFFKAGCATRGCNLDWCALLDDDHAETVPWLGAIFAAVWAALYARFSSQWSYLAGVYNTLRQTLVGLKDLDHLRTVSDGRANQLDLWRAGFVEDALDVHLATKSIFGPFILRTIWGKYADRVPGTFDANTHDGKERRLWLQDQLKERFRETAKIVDPGCDQASNDCPDSSS